MSRSFVLWRRARSCGKHPILLGLSSLYAQDRRSDEHAYATGAGCTAGRCRGTALSGNLTSELPRMGKLERLFASTWLQGPKGKSEHICSFFGCCGIQFRILLIVHILY